MKANQKAQTGKTRKQKTKIIQLNAFRQSHQLETERLIDGIWSMAQAALWPNQEFNSKEQEDFKTLIVLHFFKCKSNKQTFTELIERICLAKRYVTRRPGRYIAKPQDWLNIYYPMGLAGTEKWLQAVNAIRADVPEYNKGIRDFAKGLLSFIETRSGRSFHKCRQSMIEQKQFDLLRIFNNTIINLQYGI